MRCPGTGPIGIGSTFPGKGDMRVRLCRVSRTATGSGWRHDVRLCPARESLKLREPFYLCVSHVIVVPHPSQSDDTETVEA